MGNLTGQFDLSKSTGEQCIINGHYESELVLVVSDIQKNAAFKTYEANVLANTNNAFLFKVGQEISKAQIRAWRTAEGVLALSIDGVVQ